jgi:hypothetical protein
MSFLDTFCVPACLGDFKIAQVFFPASEWREIFDNYFSTRSPSGKRLVPGDIFRARNRPET